MHTMYSIKAFYLKDSPLKKDTRDMMNYETLVHEV